MKLWKDVLLEYETILYLPISSGLSGSYETAHMLSGEEAFEGKVFVVNHGRVSSPLRRTILDTLELVEEGYTAEYSVANAGRIFSDSFAAMDDDYMNYVD